MLTPPLPRRFRPRKKSSPPTPRAARPLPGQHASVVLVTDRQAESPGEPSALPARSISRWRTSYSALLVLGATLLASRAHAGLNVWTSAGPENVVVTALAVDAATAGTVYAGTAGNGVFRSADGGGSWQHASTGLGDTYVSSIVIDSEHPDTLYVASPNRGVFSSTDHGDTWTPANRGLHSQSAHLLAVDARGRVLYVSSNEGVFASIDGAHSWRATSLALPAWSNAWIDCLVVDAAGAVYACFFTAESPEGAWELRRSVDAGDSWDSVVLPIPGGPLAVAMDSDMPGIMHAVLYDASAATYRVCTSGGRGWMPIHGTMPGCDGPCRIYELAVDAAPGGAPDTLYAATANGVYTSTEWTSTWTPLNTGIAGKEVRRVVIDPHDPSVLYAATSSGVYSIRQAQGCAGDCDGDAAVSIAELVAMVDIALGRNSMAACGAADADRNGALVVSEVISAVEHALMGCE